MLALVDVIDEVPGPGQIAVDVRGAGVNPVDAKRYGGQYGNAGPFPMAIGMEAAGVVTAVGDGAVGPRARFLSATRWCCSGSAARRQTVWSSTQQRPFPSRRP